MRKITYILLLITTIASAQGEFYLKVNGQLLTSQKQLISVDTTTPPTPEPTFPNDYVAYYPLNNGNFNDTNGVYNLTGTANDTTDRFGNLNKAAGFTALNLEYIYINSDLGVDWNGPFTVCGFLLNMGESRFALTNQTNSFPNMRQRGSPVILAFVNDANTNVGFVGTSSISASWNFLLIERTSGGVVNYYINNVFSETHTPSGTFNNINRFTLGAWYRGSSIIQYENGLADDIYIYNRVLTPEEKNLIMNQGGWTP